ncbi:hypothetical protein [Nostoc sp.]
MAVINQDNGQVTPSCVGFTRRRHRSKELDKIFDICLVPMRGDRK